MTTPSSSPAEPSAKLVEQQLFDGHPSVSDASSSASDEVPKAIDEETRGTGVSRSLLSLVASMIDRVGPLPTLPSPSRGSEK